MSDGRVLQVNVSDGGVPKLPVGAARVTSAGVEGDRQHEVTVHGGPHRAVAILGIEAIRRVAADGHPIGPGTTGENLTIEGFDVSALPLGTRLAVGAELILELSVATNPCRNIRHSFSDLRFGRLSIKAHPADSRMYARVIRGGTVRPGDPIRLTPPADETAEHFAIAWRLDQAERVSTVAFWRAAAAAGFEITIMDDGDVAAAASPSLPGPIFNSALGFAQMPNLVDRALQHFASNGVSGWVLADDPPWPGAIADVRLARYAVDASAVVHETDGVAVRELGRDEIGPWADVIIASSDLTGPIAEAWRALEAPLARAAHHHRYVAELDGHPVAAASLHTHRALGWMRAASVLPAFRGRGIQRALLAHRAREALRLGCDLVGASAIHGGVSAQNLERSGFQRIGTRINYRAGTAA